jgi:hypothetical protein
MQWAEIMYDEYLAANFVGSWLVRRFRNCVVWAEQTPSGSPVLLIKALPVGVTVCEYETESEREEDIRYLRTLPPGGGLADSGVAVRPRPIPPSRTARDAQPLPKN